ncbi:MAG: adenylate kinase [Paludibacteraceae bacterium]
MLNVIICGAPGSGKGTQSDLIIKKYNLQHFSTGDILRKEIANETELGKYAQKFIEQGKLVPDGVIIDMIANKIDGLDKSQINGIIFDGFPRTVAQAEALEALLKKRGIKTDLLLDLDVEEQELIDRLLLRGQTSGRSDDNLDTIKKRLEVYHSQTKPVTEYYESLGKYVSIFGMGSVDEIFSKIVKAIDEI